MAAQRSELERLGIPVSETERRFRERAAPDEARGLESNTPPPGSQPGPVPGVEPRPSAGLAGVLASNDPDRLAMRLRRAGLTLDAGLAQLRAFQARGEEMPSAFGLEANAEGRVAPEVAAQAADAAAFLERIIGRRDFVEARFLEAGARAARAVGRVRIRRRDGASGYGTGSLVAPRLMLTNHHVLSTSDDAGSSRFELNVQDDVDGRPLTPESFRFRPAEFFAADKDLDFCLVAVAPASESGAAIDAFGWNTPFEGDDPVVVQEYVNIVQHPDGRPKEIALRDNQVTDLLPDFLHYRADTEPGSSGAPIFSDDWELVGLHHSGVPRRVDGKVMTRDGRVWREEMGESAIDWIANEGVRISRILAFIKALTIRDATKKRFRDSLFQAARPADEPIRTTTRRKPAVTIDPTEGEHEPAVTPDLAPAPAPAIAAASAGGAVTLTIPLQVTIALGTPTAGAAPAAVSPGGGAVGLMADEAVTIDPDYGHREGYDPDFLGTGARAVALPKLSVAQRKLAAAVQGAPADNPHELKYHHYSVVFNARRKIAFFTAVNIDGQLAGTPTRERDKWFADPRIGRDLQLLDSFYAGNAFDRGHLVRRLDPAWGRTERIIKVANDDTFHFTNCSPQHERFNQGKNLWAGLEDYLLNRATDDRKRLTVFTGPVLADDDPKFRGVPVPRQFWKVAVVVRPNGKLAALGFVVSQAALLETMEEEAAVDVARTFQVPVKQIARITGLDFGPLAKLDGGTVEGFGREAVSTESPLESFDDIVLPDDDGQGDEEGRSAASSSRKRSSDRVEAGSEAFDEEGIGGGPPYIMVSFDENGRERSDAPGGLASDRVVAALRGQPITDVFVMSHGWMGDVPAARDQFRRWSTVMASVPADVAKARKVRPGFRPLIVGIHWPSKPWGDEVLTPDEGREAAVGHPVAADVDALVNDYAVRLGDRRGLRRPLRTVIAAAAANPSPKKMPAKVVEAYEEIGRILGLSGEGVAGAPGDDHEAFDPVAIYEQRRKEADATRAEESLELPTAESLLDPLRMASFWTMKGRARVVGERGAYPFLFRLIRATGDRDVRFHLMGHSFGSIVVSAAVAGLPGTPTLPRPVYSIALVQGALSLWSYCSNIPAARGTPGYFRRIVADKLAVGPIVTTRTDYDRALRIFYPRGAQMAGDFEARMDLPKYGAVGIYGLQGPGLDIADELIKRTDAPYAFRPGTIVNLDASGVIRNGGGAAGAHSDIDHPEVAHAIWSAALAE